MNYPALITILEFLESHITSETIVKGTIYDNPAELEDDLDAYISEFLENSGSWIQHLDVHFKKNGTIQKIIELNNWDISFETLYNQYQEAKK